MARAFEAKRKAEWEYPDTLADLYRQYWSTHETEPLETFRAIVGEIAIVEAQLDPGQVIDILEAEARKFHGETGCCPHCRQMGPLHHGPDGNEPR